MFAYDPLICLMFCEDQLLLAKKIINGEKYTLHLDATGSLLRQNKNEKRIFLYSFVLPYSFKDEPCLPLVEWVTNNHTALNLSSLLQRFFLHAQHN